MNGPEPPPPSPAKIKLSAAERRARQADRLTTIRLRMAIWRELDDRGIAEAAAIGEALGLPAAAAGLLARGTSGAKATWRCCRPPRPGWA